MKYKLKSKNVKLLLVFLIVILLIIIWLKVNVKANESLLVVEKNSAEKFSAIEGKVVTLICKDKNFYNAIIEKLDYENHIYECNEELLTIMIEKNYIENIISLDLKGKQIEDISGIENLKSLINLDLSNNQIEDITPLELITSIKNLDLSYNQINNISALTYMSNLTNLNLSNNQISSVCEISNLIVMDSLNLSNNKLVDISGLERLIYLRTLNLSNNQIENISILKSKSFYNNLIIDYSSEIAMFSNKINNLTVYADSNCTEIEIPPYIKDECKLGILNNCVLSEDENKLILQSRAQLASVFYNKHTFLIKRELTEEEKSKSLVSIEIANAPTKTKYFEGEYFDASGMKIIAKYDDESEEEITNFRILNGNNLVAGQNSITIVYSESNFSDKEQELNPNLYLSFPNSFKEYVMNCASGSAGGKSYLEYQNEKGDILRIIAVPGATVETQTFIKVIYEIKETNEIYNYLFGYLDENTLWQNYNVTPYEMPKESGVWTYDNEDSYMCENGYNEIAKYYDVLDKEEFPKFEGDFNLIEVGEKEQTSYLYLALGITTSIDQEISVVKPMDKIEIKVAPTKVNYIEGENFDKTGMKVVVTYIDNTTEEITDYEVIDGKNLEAEKTSVTIRYEENGESKTVNQAITVEKLKTNIEPNMPEYDIEEKETEDEKKEYYLKIFDKNVMVDRLLERLIIKENVAYTVYEIAGETKTEVIQDKKETTKVKTGSIVIEFEKERYITVIMGDLNKDGDVTFEDLLAVNKIRLHQEEAAQTLEEILKIACDINGDGQVTFMEDMVKINAERLK